MTALEQITVPDADAVKVEAVAAVLRDLGVGKAALFFRDHFSRKTDSVSLKRELFDAESVTSLVSQIQAER